MADRLCRGGLIVKFIKVLLFVAVLGPAPEYFSQSGCSLRIVVWEGRNRCTTKGNHQASTKAMKKSSDSPWWTFFLGIYLTQLFSFPRCRSHSHIYLRWQFLTLFPVRCDECSLNAVQMTAQPKACSSSFIHAVNKIKELYQWISIWFCWNLFGVDAGVESHLPRQGVCAFELISIAIRRNFNHETKFSLNPKALSQPQKLLIRFFPR